MRDTQVAIMSFPLQHTTCGKAAADGVRLCPDGAGLTATQPALLRADPHDCLDLGPPTIQTAHLWGHQRQAMGGIILFAVSDHEHVEAPTQPATLGPVKMSPMVTEGVTMKPTMLVEPADDIPAVLANALQQDLRGIPGVKEPGLGTTTQAMAGTTQPRQRQRVLRSTSCAPEPHPERDAESPVRPNSQHQREAIHGLVLLAGKDPGEPLDDRGEGLRHHGIIDDERAALPANERAHSERKEGFP